MKLHPSPKGMADFLGHKNQQDPFLQYAHIFVGLWCMLVVIPHWLLALTRYAPKCKDEECIFFIKIKF